MPESFANKTVLVLGLGDSGFSMACWLARQGAKVRVADSRDQPPYAKRLAAAVPQAILSTGAFQRENFNGIDLIAISPGVPVNQPLINEAHASGVPVVGDVELFAQALPVFQPTAQVIAITGSNGKSTVTTMVGDMCKSAGLHTVVAGNIGLPVLDALTELIISDTEADVFVLELSSFQLETTHSLQAVAATVLNISEDHLDRYPDMQAYAAAKAKIFGADTLRVLNRDDAMSMVMAQPDTVTFGLDVPADKTQWGVTQADNQSWLVQGDQALMALTELPVAGLHNAANALAALALCRALDLPYPALIQALRNFKGLPHRVQKVAAIDGVTFIDDSKGTNVGATVAALAGMTATGKVILIAGGEGKGQDFSPLNSVLHQQGRAVVLIGRDAETIARAIEGCGIPMLRAESMEEAVQKSFAQAQSGDVVLMSPACASFDMFRNYAHRAEVFIEAVKALEGYAHA